MPGPTKPVCIGSWPEPPPDTSATFPRTGESHRLTKAGLRDTRRRSGCAAARPRRASPTTSSGRLISFFTSVEPEAHLAGRRGVGLVESRLSVVEVVEVGDYST